MSHLTSRPLSDKELLGYTNQTQIRDLETCQQLLEDEKRNHLIAVQKVRNHALRLPLGLLRLPTTFITTGVDAFDAFIIGAGLTFPVSISLVAFLRPTALTAVFICLATAGLLTGAFFLLLRTGSSEHGKDRRALRRATVTGFLRNRSALVQSRQGCLNRIRYYTDLGVNLQRALRRADEIAALLSTDFRLMHNDGHEFEDFLERVFNVLGYPEVRPTRQTGDKGIDLVVFDGRCRIAIQAKHWSGSVGVEAVQEAVAGMAVYGCTRCAAITTSVFTRPAVDLANANNCRLIDGEGIRRLIAGKEVL